MQLNQFREFMRLELIGGHKSRTSFYQEKECQEKLIFDVVYGMEKWGTFSNMKPILNCCLKKSSFTAICWS